MRDVLRDIAEWTRRGEKIALATVVGVRRSAPRPPGAKMAVNEHGEIAGAVSGGCVERAVVEIADRVIRGGPPRLEHFGIADDEAWDVGLPCGGEIDVWVQAYRPGRFEEVARSGGRAAEVTMLEGPNPGSKLLLEADGARSGSLGAPEIDDEAARAASELLWAERSERRGALFYDVTAPDPRLIIFGAVDVAASLCRLARAAGWRPFVVDPRDRFATAARFPDAEEVIAGWPEHAFARLGGIDRATSIVVLTHDPKLDDAALKIALRSPARFVGAMGSRRAQATRRERLLAAGLGEEELARLSAPLGLDLGAVNGEETALSILAEVVAARHGHEGGRLAAASRRIHEGTRVNDRGGAPVAGLILAAGEGARFGARPKLLADLGGRPLLEHAIGAQCAVEEIERIVVVLGAHAPELLASVNFMRAEPVLCEEWREGMASSLRRGVRALDGSERVIVTLGDQPLLSSEVIARFVDAPPGTRATYDGRPGHPVTLGPEQLRAVRGLRGDRGARELLGDAPAIECGHLGRDRDVDTPTDLDAIRDEVRAVL